MSSVRSPKKERSDTALGIDKKTKTRLKNLDFVKKNTWKEILNTLMDFYEENKPQFEKWKKLKEKI